MMYSESVRSPSRTTTVFFGNVRVTARSAKSLRSSTSRSSSGDGPLGLRFSIGSPRSSSAREPRLGQAPYPEPGDAKQTPREELRLCFLGEALVRGRVLHPRHRRDVDLVELVPAEDDAGDVPDRHADAPLDRAVGRVAHQVARDQLRVPYAALGVHGRAVGDAGIVLERGEEPLVRRRAGLEVVIVLPDLVLEGVGEVEGLVVGAPARSVRADDSVVDQGHGEIGIEAPQRADLQLLLVVHASREEASAAVALAVVQARARVFGIDERYGFELAALEIEEVEAVVEREHRAAFLAQRERADVALERPVLGLAAPRIEPPDRRLADAPAGPVNPIEPAFLDVPHRAFAEMVGALQDTFDLHETGD